MGFSGKYFSCIKILLVILNFILLLIGLVFIGIGVWLRVDPKMYEPTNFIAIQNYIIAAYILIGTGFVIVIISFMACFGAANDYPCLLCAYFAIMSIVVALEIAAIVLSVTHGFGSNLEEYLKEQVVLQIQKRQLEDKSRAFLDFIQVKLRCCGGENFNDYHRYGMEIPVSCAGERTNFINQEGCGIVLRRFIELRAGLIVGLCVVAGLLQLACIVGAINVYCAIKHNDYGDDD